MKKVLIADDRPNSRELIRAMLEAAGYEVLEAADGAEGLHCARELSPDLLILDIQMPVLDGFGAISALRQDPALCRMPVLALTANAMQMDKQRAIDAGFDSYISKPVGMMALIREVERLLDSRSDAGRAA